MATETRLVDDLDATYDDVQTCTLTWNGRSVEIDLSAANRDRFDQLLEPVLAAGRRPGRSAGGAPRPRASRGELTRRAQVRAWAKDTGQPVPERGPIPAEVEAAYAASRTPQQPPPDAGTQEVTA